MLVGQMLVHTSLSSTTESSLKPLHSQSATILCILGQFAPDGSSMSTRFLGLSTTGLNEIADGMFNHRKSENYLRIYI